jgi:hypothetical protein
MHAAVLRASLSEQDLRARARALHLRPRRRTKPLAHEIGTAARRAACGSLCEAQAERGRTIYTRRDGRKSPPLKHGSSHPESAPIRVDH